MAKILLIDDDHEFRAMVRKMLERGGYNDIEEAPNGSIGAKLFRQQSFDLVITDLIMPEKEGIETIIELRTGAPVLKILAISGGIPGADPRDFLKIAQKLGADSALDKPFTAQKLAAVVGQLLEPVSLF